MNKISAAALLTIATTTASAQIPVDISQSKISIDSSQGVLFENLTVPGVGSVNLKFRWNPHTVSFEPVVETLDLQGAYCEQAVASGNISYSSTATDGYQIRQRTTDSITWGALTTASSRPYGFTVAWAKTVLPQDNPYLTGKSLPQFDPSKAYGVIGQVHTGSYSGFAQGMLVEITGSMAAGAFNIKQVGGTASTTFTLGANSATSRSHCASSNNGLYSGNTAYSSANANGYRVIFLSTGSGTITAASGAPYEFTATWEGQVKPGLYAGRMAAVHTGSYARFTATAPILVADVGDGLSVMSLSSSGEVLGTAVFTK